MASGSYLDGRHPIRHAVYLLVDDTAVEVRDVHGVELARWPLSEIRRQDGATGKVFLRLGPSGIGAERLEVSDPALAARIESALPRRSSGGGWSLRDVTRLAGLCGLALVSVGTLLVFGIPFAADRIAPFVPARVEANIGRITDAQLRLLLRPGGGRFECDGAAGRAVLDGLTARLTAGGDYAIQPRIAVVDIGAPNAIALPGGQIYVFRGLLRRAGGPDEVIAVLAHELGHVRARHGMRAVLQSGSASFIVGLLFGDFAGAGALALVTQGLLRASHSREAEREADRFAVDLVLRQGGDARALGRALTRISRAAGAESGPSYFDSHPFTPERVAAIDASAAGRVASGPMMTDDDWSALRTICD